MAAIHGTCLDFNGFGVLLRGGSGTGKSDLALRLIRSGSAILVADDYVRICEKDGRLHASAPKTIAGRLEVRGAGILRIDYAQDTKLELVIDLVSANEVERLPDRLSSRTAVKGIDLPKLELCAFEASAPDKLIMIVHAMQNDGWAEDIVET